MLQSTFPENICLSCPGRPCKRKNWFDHNVIIRGYVYVSSVVHATEIHLPSLIGAHTCMPALGLGTGQFVPYDICMDTK